MRFFRAWLFGERALDHMDALTAPGGYPKVEAWLPLDGMRSTPEGLDRHRSAWVQHLGEDGELWVEFGLPVPVIVEHLGPHALTCRFGMCRTKARLADLRMRDGHWMIGVPRFFLTITEQWTGEPQDRTLLVTVSGERTVRTTVAAFDPAASLDGYRDDPELLVGPDGPLLFGPVDERYRSTWSWEERLDSALAGLMQLPPTTPVTAAWCRY